MNSLVKRQKEMYTEGCKIEEYFIDLAQRDGFETIKATPYQDRHEHWDVLLIKNNKHARIDVKGIREGHDIGCAWLEFKAVDGRDGWMFGKAHGIAMEKDDYFDVYNRKKLRDFVLKKIKNPSGYVFIKPMDLKEIIYHRYKRAGRDDWIVLVPYNDIEEFIIKKIYK